MAEKALMVSQPLEEYIATIQKENEVYFKSLNKAMWYNVESLKQLLPLQLFIFICLLSKLDEWVCVSYDLYPQ